MKAETTVISLAVAAIIGGFLLAGARAEEPRRFTYLQIAVSESIYENPAFTNKLDDLWTWLTGSADTTPIHQGWANGYRHTVATNVTVYVYRNSLKNIKADLTRTVSPSVMSNIVARINSYPQAKCAVTRTPDAALASWNVEPKPTEGP